MARVTLLNTSGLMYDYAINAILNKKNVGTFYAEMWKIRQA